MSDNGSISGTHPPGSKPPVDPNLFHSILVHNVTHSDLLLGLISSDAGSPSSAHNNTFIASLLASSVIAQPKFHKYATITREVLKRFSSDQNKSPVYFPSLHYNQTIPTPAASVPSTPITSPTSASSPAASHPLPPPPLATLPYGFSFTPPLPSFPSYDGFRLRSSTSADVLPASPTIVAFYFPMLSVLIPKWLQKCETQRLKREIMSATSSGASPASTASSTSSPSSHRLFLYLVSGGGQPWDRSLDSATNSTKCTAQLCQLFLQLHYPQVAVHLIHSRSDIFHYDGNVHFVNSQLLPRLQQHRRDLSSMFYENYPRHLHTSISITDGPPARVNAIHASLRSYSPDCLHMWQLKSFWHEYPRITGRGEHDVEYQEFDKIEMTPPVRVADCREQGVRELVERMVEYKTMFETRRDGDEYNELGAFWMRKSRKPVLSVLMVESRRRGRRWYRGLNMEVSMPTGSLCSERSAIGSALSDDVGLCRKDVKLIAVLALPLERKEKRGVEEEERERRREEEVVQEMKELESTSPTLSGWARSTSGDVVLSPMQLPRRAQADAADPPPHVHELPDGTDGDSDRDEQDGAEQGSKRRRLSRGGSAVLSQRSDSSGSLGSLGGGGFEMSPAFLPSPSSSSVREYGRKQQQLEQELLLMKIRREQHSGDDEGRNPINPCGACNEWLKKIAEVNPDFKVVTFTSTDCNTIFVKSVKF